MLNFNVNLVEVNCNQLMALKLYFDQNKNVLSPCRLRAILKNSPSIYDYISNNAKLDILDYCLSDHRYNDLSGLRLLQLLSGDFVQFTQIGRFSYSTTTTFICSETVPHTLLPGLEHMLVSVYSNNATTHSNLLLVAKSGQTQQSFCHCPIPYFGQMNSLNISGNGFTIKSCMFSFNCK